MKDSPSCPFFTNSDVIKLTQDKTTPDQELRIVNVIINHFKEQVKDLLVLGYNFTHFSKQGHSGEKSTACQQNLGILGQKNY